MGWIAVCISLLLLEGVEVRSQGWGGTRVISGVVLNAKTNQPLAQAQVRVTESHSHRLMGDTVTDEEGRFSFGTLPEGKFDLYASHRGFVGADFDQHEGGVSTAIVTGEGLVSTGLRFPLAPQAVIFGMVAEDSGDPVPGASVSLYRKDEGGGLGKMVRAGTTQADALGKFELPNLRPGRYYLCASGSPWYARHVQGGRQEEAAKELGRAPLDVAYAIACSPGVTDPTAAEAIVLAGGDRVQADVTMHPVAAVHISLPRPSRFDGISMPQIRQEVFGFSEPVPAGMSSSQSTNGDGTVTSSAELTGFPPGRYEVEVQGRDGQPGRIASLDANAGETGFNEAAGAPMGSVSGRVTLAAGEDSSLGLSVELAPEDGERAVSAPAGKDGTFKMEAVQPGEYDVVVNASGAAMTVTRLSAKGASLRGRVLVVSSEPIELKLTAARAVATVSGFVKRGGQAASGVFVALLPVSADAGRETRQPNQSDSDGSFFFPNLPAGDYLVMAVEDGWGLEWARREVMAKYMARAVKVTVPPHAKEVTLSEAVEVQAK